MPLPATFVKTVAMPACLTTRPIANGNKQYNSPAPVCTATPVTTLFSLRHRRGRRHAQPPGRPPPSFGTPPVPAGEGWPPAGACGRVAAPQGRLFFLSVEGNGGPH